MREFEFTAEEKQTVELIKSARNIQDFLWGEMNDECGLEEFKRMLRKRLVKIDDIELTNPHWKVEFRKRLLQLGAIAIQVMVRLDNDQIKHGGTHPTLPSNLPKYATPLSKSKCICHGYDGEPYLHEVNDKCPVHGKKS